MIIFNNVHIKVEKYYCFFKLQGVQWLQKKGIHWSHVWLNVSCVHTESLRLTGSTLTGFTCHEIQSEA